ncbi:MAG: CvpA family protein [Ginsengibacter sp.]
MIIDITFLLVMILAIFKGLSKGFIVGIFSFLGFVIGLAAALKLSVIVATYLGDHVIAAKKWLPVLSFLLVFIVVILLVGLGARILKKTIAFAMLGWFDRLGGMILYIIIYIIIFSVILFFVEKIFLIRTDTINNSFVYKYVSPWGPKVINNLGNIIPFFKGMFMQLEDFFEKMAQKTVSLNVNQILFRHFFA